MQQSPPVLHFTFYRFTEAPELQILKMLALEMSKIRGVEASVDTCHGGPRWPSKSDILQALGVTDGTNGYTHMLLVVGVDLNAVRSLAISSVITQHWAPTLDPLIDATFAVACDCPLSLERLSSVPLLRLSLLHTESQDSDISPVRGLVDDSGLLPGLSLGIRVAKSSPPLFHSLEAKSRAPDHCLIIAADDAISLRGCLGRKRWRQVINELNNFSFDTELRFDHDDLVVANLLSETPGPSHSPDVSPEAPMEDPGLVGQLAGRVVAVPPLLVLIAAVVVYLLLGL